MNNKHIKQEYNFLFQWKWLNMKLKHFFIKQSSYLKDNIKDRENIVIFFSLAIFFLLNTLKIAVFNLNILPRTSFKIFIYKCIYTLLVILIFYPLILRLKSKIIFIAFYILQILYILINASYYLYFNNYLHIRNFISLLSEGLSAVSHSTAPIEPIFILFFIDLPIAIYMLIKYDKVTKLVKGLRLFVVITIIFSMCGLGILEGYNYKLKKSIIQYIDDMHGGESSIVLHYGTLTNNIINIFIDGSEAQLVSNFRYGMEKSSERELQNKCNIIMIQVESMDSNIINKKHNGNYVTPYLNSLASNSVFYPYVLSYHMGGGTSDAEFSILNSIQPLTDFPAIKITNYDYGNSVVKQFNNALYSTLAFHGNVGNYYNRDVAFPKMGFKQFYDINKMNLSPRGWGVSDKEMFDFASDTLKTEDQPFFAYTITMTSHIPYTNVSNYYKNDNYSDIKNETVRNYFKSLSYVDQAIKEFVTNIKNNFEDTYILIYGDHTPNIDTGEYKQASFKYNDKYFEFVPLFIITPDNKVYKEDKQVASFLDISLTVLNLSGIKYNIKSDGVDLVKASEIPNSIPYKGLYIDRIEIFKEIKSIQN